MAEENAKDLMYEDSISSCWLHDGGSHMPRTKSGRQEVGEAPTYLLSFLGTLMCLLGLNLWEWAQAFPFSLWDVSNDETLEIFLCFTVQLFKQWAIFVLYPRSSFGDRQESLWEVKFSLWFCLILCSFLPHLPTFWFSYTTPMYLRNTHKKELTGSCIASLWVSSFGF